MNKERREQLNELHGNLHALMERAQALIDNEPEGEDADNPEILLGRKEEANNIRDAVGELKSELDSVRGEEQDYYDNMHENFQNGEKGEKAQAAIDEMDNADTALDSAVSDLEDCSDLESAVSNIDEALSSIDNATA